MEPEKLTELSKVVDELMGLALQLGRRARLRGEKFQVKGTDVSFLLDRRSNGEDRWTVVLFEGDSPTWREVRDSRVALKKLFLEHAEDFFTAYLEHVSRFESTFDRDLKRGRETVAWLKDVAKERLDA